MCHSRAPHQHQQNDLATNAVRALSKRARSARSVGEKCAKKGPRDCPNVLRIGVSPDLSDSGCAGTAVLLYPMRSSVVDDVEPSKRSNTRTGRKSQSGPESFASDGEPRSYHVCAALRLAMPGSAAGAQGVLAPALRTGLRLKSLHWRHDGRGPHPSRPGNRNGSTDHQRKRQWPTQGS
jgi:hypothetical protein